MTEADITALVERIVTEKLAERERDSFQRFAKQLAAEMAKVEVRLDGARLNKVHHRRQDAPTGAAITASEAECNAQFARWVKLLVNLDDRGFDQATLVRLAKRGPASLPDVEALSEVDARRLT